MLTSTEANTPRRQYPVFTAGYGSRDVSKCLDAQVKRIFSLRSAVVPTLEQKSLKESKTLLKAAKLKLGVVHKQPHDDDSHVGKVLKQSPAAGTTISRGGFVDVTVGVRKIR